jgi:hypothetical protein
VGITFQQYLGSPVAYPGIPFGPPPPNHPAVANSNFWVSAACFGVNFIMSTGQGGNVQGTPTFANYNTGPAWQGAPSAYVLLIDPAGTNAKSTFTFAAITNLDSTSGDIFSNTSVSSSGYAVGLSAGQVTLSRNGTAVLTGGSPPFGPAFIVAGNNSANAFIAVADLVSGSISLTTGTTLTAPSSSNGQMTIGNDPNLSFFSPSSGISRVMWSYSAITNSQALAWTQDPWAFWHPNHTAFSLSSAANAAAGDIFANYQALLMM